MELSIYEGVQKSVHAIDKRACVSFPHVNDCSVTLNECCRLGRGWAEISTMASC